MPDSSQSTGRLFVVSAPSGAGKTTLVKRAVQLRPDLRFSVSYTTRQKRPGEEDGRDYFFVDDARFTAMASAGEFLESATVFGNSYGTGRTQVQAMLAEGDDVLLEIDWQGAEQVRANLPGCVTVFILPPSLTELERRLRGRQTDSDEVIARRLDEARGDMSHWPDFDFVVINDDLDSAVADLCAVLDGQGDGCRTSDPALQARVDALLTG